jgi:hypothetical protein
VLPLPRTGDPIWVTLRHWDRPCSPPLRRRRLSRCIRASRTPASCR